jgi:DNA invertase Pin-like site-specific DNA recombinase
MRAVLYHRVSTRDQNAEIPREELRQVAAARGWEVVADIAEVGSGWNFNRPGLQQVMRLVERHAVDVVVVWKVCRFGRTVFDFSYNMNRLRKAGVIFYSTSQGIEYDPDPKAPGSAMYLFMLHNLAALAEYETTLISERTQAAADYAARKKGPRWGRSKTLDSQMAGIADTMRDTGETWERIAVYLRDVLKVKTTAASVRRAVMERRLNALAKRLPPPDVQNLEKLD